MEDEKAADSGQKEAALSAQNPAGERDSSSQQRDNSSSKKSTAEIKKMFETEYRLDLTKIKAIQQAKDNYK